MTKNNQVTAFAISNKTSFSRKKQPTKLEEPSGHAEIPERSKSRRLRETLLVSSEIHGASEENRQPALDGMFCTLEKYASIKCFEDYMNTSKILSHVSTSIVKKDVTEFEKSPENTSRSLSILYGAGLLSKRKYAHVRSALSTTCLGMTTAKGYLQKSRLKLGGGIPLLKTLPYKKLISKVNEIDIGELLSVRDLLCSDLPEALKVDGVYRNLESMLLSLAQFYLEVDTFRKEDDRHLENGMNLFHGWLAF